MKLPPPIMASNVIQNLYSLFIFYVLLGFYTMIPLGSLCSRILYHISDFSYTFTVTRPQGSSQLRWVPPQVKSDYIYTLLQSDLRAPYWLQLYFYCNPTSGLLPASLGLSSGQVWLHLYFTAIRPQGSSHLRWAPPQVKSQHLVVENVFTTTSW